MATKSPTIPSNSFRNPSDQSPFLRSRSMADINTFVKRLDEQVAQVRGQVERKQAEIQQAYEARKERYKTFLQVLKELHGVAQPRLEKLAEHCKFDATPSDGPDGRSAVLDFKTR